VFDIARSFAFQAGAQSGLSATDAWAEPLPVVGANARVIFPFRWNVVRATIMRNGEFSRRSNNSGNFAMFTAIRRVG
jgi:hypothetical protein